MKKLMIMALATLMGLSVTAQVKPGKFQKDATQMAQKETERMVEKYGLSKKQAKKLLVLNQEYATKWQPRQHRALHKAKPEQPKMGQMQPDSMRQKPRMDAKKHEEMHAKRAEMQKAYDEKLQKIMTKKQFENYQEDQKQARKERRRERPIRQ